MESSVPPATTDIPLDSDKVSENFAGSLGGSNNNGSTFSNGIFNPSNSSSVGSRLAGADEEIVTQQEPIESPFADPTQIDSNASGDVQMKSTMDSRPAVLPCSSLNKRSANHPGFGNSTKKVPQVTKMTFQEVQQVASEKAESLKMWGVKAFKCTKQLLAEKMGRGTRTVDLELEARIEVLRDTKQKYENIVALMTQFTNHFSLMCQTQKVLGEAFGELAGKSQDLQEEFQFNGETQYVLAKNGERLLAAVNFFIGGMKTLCSKTMDDTLTTISRYESARIEYDAYRTELESIKLAPRTEANLNKQAASQLNFSKQKEVYEKLRADVGVKLQFLDENRMKVMQKQLLLFHNAITAYFAGNQQQLNASLQQFSIKVNNQPSWLEKSNGN